MNTIYKILVRDNINQRFITLLNDKKRSYLQNLKVIRKAEEDLKANIIFNGITTDKEDILNYISQKKEEEKYLKEIIK